MKTEDTEALGKQSRSKLDPVDQPVRTARTIVHHYSPSSRPISHLSCGQLEVRGPNRREMCLVQREVADKQLHSVKFSETHSCISFAY